MASAGDMQEKVALCALEVRACSLKDLKEESQWQLEWLELQVVLHPNKVSQQINNTWAAPVPNAFYQPSKNKKIFRLISAFQISLVAVKGRGSWGKISVPIAIVA